jgi:hypothetical protein
MSADNAIPRGDVKWREVGIGMAVLTKTCGQCLKPRGTTGGQIRYVRGLVKKSFVCAGCCAKGSA